MMRINQLRIFSIAIFACMTSCLFACVTVDGGYTHPDFKTEYTIEEHIERITARTEEKFETELAEGEIANIKVEILYAFYDNDPEYFMVELEYVEEFTGEYPYRKDNGTEDFISYTTKYKHFIGFIEDDKYCARVKGYAGIEDGKQAAKFVDGQNPYELSGYTDAKKYCNSQSDCAVQTDEGVLQIFDSTWYGGVEFDIDEERFEQHIMSEEEQKGLMTSIYYANYRYCLY